MSVSRVNNNISAINAQRNLDKTGRNIQRSVERLSSGLRINRAGDDAAGLVISSRLRTQVQGLNQAIDNASNGISLINVAEGALEETTTRLNRIRQLAIQAANTGVNDFKARSALQDEVFQSIDEITRIANTTQFSSNFLLNGDFSIQTELIDGQEAIGVNIDASPVASTLLNGKSFLNIIKTKEETKQIIAGDTLGGPQTLNTGITNQSDLAVTNALFTTATDVGVVGNISRITARTTTLANNMFNGVSIRNATNGIVFSFNGVLSDGKTTFTGSLSMAFSSTVASLVSTINISIRDAERALFGVSSINSVPTSFRTVVTLGAVAASNAGRLILLNQGNFQNQASIDIRVSDSGNLLTQANGVVRSGSIGATSGLVGTGQIGNSVTAITGSTFGAGQFEIEVYDVQAAQQRRVESTVRFYNGDGSVISRTSSLRTDTSNGRNLVLNGTFVNGIYTGGTTLYSGDTVTLNGTNADGTTFTTTFTLTNAASIAGGNADTHLDDFQFHSVSGLVQELNFRTRRYDAAVTSISSGIQTRFEDALFTFTSNGTLQLIDDLGRSNSQLSFTLTFNAQAANNANSSTNVTIQDDAVLIQEGFYEEGAFRINGGEAVRAKAGDVITLEGAKSTIEGIPQPKVTFRIGTGFSAGVDKLETTQAEFVGSLNGGTQVTFANGDQDVVFIDGTSGGSRGVARFVTVDFDGIIDVTKNTTGLNDTGRTVIISTVNRSFNFQIGANSNQSFRASIGDLKSDSLGFGRGSGRTVSDINVSSLTGANAAIDIIDEALEQVNKTRSILGAATNRLESTISNLSVSAENLTASESRIRDADIAKESSEFTKQQVLIQAGLSVLAQANFQSQGFLQLLG